MRWTGIKRAWRMTILLVLAFAMALGQVPAVAWAKAADGEQSSVASGAESEPTDMPTPSEEEGEASAGEAEEPGGEGKTPAGEAEEPLGDEMEREPAGEEESPAKDDASASDNLAEEVPLSEGDSLTRENGEAVLAAQSEGDQLTQEDGEAALAAQFVGVSNPRSTSNTSMASGKVVTWDCVWFGTYPQTEIASSDPVYYQLRNASWDASGSAIVGGVRYKRLQSSDITGDWPSESATYRYFRYEPIKWRVLRVSGNSAFLLADKALDCRVYRADGYGRTWRQFPLRSWLNGYGASENRAGIDYTSNNFINDAFAPAEEAAILTTTISTTENEPEGYQTDDRVFLLAGNTELYGSEATSYGFSDNWNNPDEGRRCKPSDFARAMGAAVSSARGYEGNCYWWLRNRGPGIYSSDRSLGVFATGITRTIESNTYGGLRYGGLRPALNISISSFSLALAGTVTSDGVVNEIVAPNDLRHALVLGLKSKGYTGQEYRPKPTVVLWGKRLTEGVDYDLTYYRDGRVATDLKGSGKISVRVSGKGSHYGNAWGSYDIWKNGQPMDAWSVARQAPAASLKARDVTVEAPIHVAHAVSAAKPMEFRKVGGDTRLNVDVATGRVTVRKGTPAGTYPVTIRAIAFGGANYADGSRTVDCQVRVVGSKLDQDLQVTAADVTRTAASLASADYLTRPFSASLAAGNVTYKLASGSSCLDVDTMGRLKVARGTKAGTYYAKVYATAAGDAGYKPCTRTVTAKVVVK